MNIFGMFFTFMVPGILLGVLASAVIAERARESRRKQHSVSVVKRTLYVHDLKPREGRAA